MATRKHVPAVVAAASGAVLCAALLLSAVWSTPPQRFRRSDTAAGNTITGRVLIGGQPAAGAIVKVKAASYFTLSNRDGYFELPLPDDLRSSFAGKPPRNAAVRVTAAKPGYFIAGSAWRGKPITLQLRAVDLRDNPDYHWIAPHPDPAKPKQCGNCHRKIFEEWAGSSHASAASNPRFWNVYDGSTAHGGPSTGWNLLQQHPRGAGVCYSCHIPSPQPDTTLLADLRRVRDGDSVHLEGVHCDFCHKIAATDLEPVGLHHGRFALQLARPVNADQPQLFGPLPDVDRGEDAYTPLYRSSKYCASCHEGVVFGIHAYTTYSEWQATKYARQGVQCQDCHMAPEGSMTNMAPGHGGVQRDPRTLASHRFPGSSPVFVRRHLEFELTAARAGDNTLAAEVRIRPQHTGHLTPTGHPSRHIILQLQGWDAAGNATSQLSGPRLPALAGDGGANGASDGIVAGQAGEIYGRTLVAATGRPAAFWDDDARFTSDTRLQPDIKHRVQFSFAAATVRIEAQLIYRRFSAYVAQQKGWQDNSHVLFRRVWPQPGASPGPQDDKPEAR